MNGKVVAIFTAPAAGAPLQTVPAAQLEAGRGIVGDRYHRRSGTFSEKLKEKTDWQVTLIELEEAERFNAEYGTGFGPGSFRRNIVTRGVRLNELVGRRFAVGGAVLEGLRLCEPCAHLAKLLGPEVMQGLVHKAGLRAHIIAGATVRPGDDILERVE